MVVIFIAIMTIRMMLIMITIMIILAMFQVPLHTLIKITPVAYGCQVHDDDYDHDDDLDLDHDDHDDLEDLDDHDDHHHD